MPTTTDPASAVKMVMVGYTQPDGSFRATMIPEARVPVGNGPAMREALNSERLTSYAHRNDAVEEAFASRNTSTVFSQGRDGEWYACSKDRFLANGMDSGVKFQKLPGWTPAIPAGVNKTPATTKGTAPMPPTSPSPSGSLDGKFEKVKTVVKADVRRAATRVAASQFLKLSGDAIAAGVAKGNNETRNQIAAFMKTEAGRAILAIALGTALELMPGNVGGVLKTELAEELRVKGMADGADMVVEMLMEPLRDVMGAYLASMNAAAEQTRIDESVTTAALGDGTGGTVASDAAEEQDEELVARNPAEALKRHRAGGALV